MNERIAFMAGIFIIVFGLIFFVYPATSGERCNVIRDSQFEQCVFQTAYQINDDKF